MKISSVKHTKWSNYLITRQLSCIEHARGLKTIAHGFNVVGILEAKDDQSFNYVLPIFSRKITLRFRSIVLNNSGFDLYIKE